ncbi:hypothetical protein M9Y10_042593 [Tritrichomonas musculus]|uniref:Protein kinase domain-containing protein n=1 Tax=Tritrichomonas musculus TaxID=1915356 RepID=A0ABR2JXM0_9EUKA
MSKNDFDMIDEIKEMILSHIKNKDFYQIIKGFDFLLPNTKKDFEDINHRINKIKIISMNTCTISHKRYVILCFDETVLFIIDEQLCLIKKYFYNNKDSFIYLMNQSSIRIFKDMIEDKDIYIETKKKFLDEIKDFLNLFENSKENEALMPICRSISAYLIQKSYCISKINRIANSSFLFKLNSKENEVDPNDFVQLPVFGHGSSQVKLIYHIKNQKLYAMKTFLDNHLFDREHENYLNVHHPFLLQYFGWTIVDSYKCLIFEFIDSLPLTKLEDKKDLIKNIFQMMLTIEYLHHKNYIYRDLKPNNFLLDQYQTFVLIDYDRMIVNEDKNKDENTTRNLSQYAANEINDGSLYSFPVDIYSLGKTIEYLIDEKNLKFLNHDLFQNELINLCNQCTKKDPKERPNISDLLDDFYSNIFSKVFENVPEIEHIKKMRKTKKNKYFKYIVFISEVNHVYSLMKLGRLFEKGKYVDQDITKMIKYFTLAADQNDDDAQYFLGAIYMKGEYVDQDMEKAVYFTTLAAGQNNELAQFNLGLIYLDSGSTKQNINKSLFYFDLAAKQNHLKALFFLGVIYYEGKYILQDIIKAFYYFQLGAKQNDPYSQFYVGKILIEGKSIEQDIKQGIKFLTLSADANNSAAQQYLAEIYSNEKYIEPNNDKFIHFLKLAADNDKSSAQNCFGMILIEGEMIKKDIKKGIHYLTNAADQDFPEAQYFIGSCYLNGKYVQQDIEKGIKYLSGAANQGHLQAQIELSSFYRKSKYDNIQGRIYYLRQAASQNHSPSQFEHGYLLVYSPNIRNIEEGMKYLLLAAEQNNNNALHHLGLIYFENTLIPKDINKAFHYLSIAANNNDIESMNLLGIIFCENNDLNKASYYFHQAAKSNLAVAN